MPAPMPSRGVCSFCGYETEREAILSHLDTCPVRLAQIATADESEQKLDTLYHLRAYSAQNRGFWLELEVPSHSDFNDLDRYLRAIWLECCGHRSAFYQGGWQGLEIRKIKQMHKIFREGIELMHYYDFSVSSETRIVYIGERQGKRLSQRPVLLMARNILPELACMQCNAPATYVCMECVYEHEAHGALCDSHAETHPHDKYGEPLLRVNSPRVGMCNYEGKAEPPY